MKGSEEKRSARSSLKSLYFIVVKWRSLEAPKAISEVPSSIVNAINNKVIPLINSGNFGLLSRVHDCFKIQTQIIFEHEPTFEDWKNFSTTLDSISYERPNILDTQTDFKSEKIILKHAGWIALFLAIGVLTGFIVKLLGGDLNTQIIMGGTASISLLAVYFGKRLLVIKSLS